MKDLLKELKGSYKEEYRRLYNLDTQEEREKAYKKRNVYLPSLFDKKMNEDKYFNLLVSIFVQYNQDCIGSDRECVAFLYAVEKVTKD